MPECLLTHVPVVVICVCNMPLKGVDDLVWIDGMEGDPLTPSCHSTTDQNQDLIHCIREHQPFTTPDSCENLRLNKNERPKCIKDAGAPRRLHWPLQSWFLLMLRLKEVVLMFCFFLFMPFPSSRSAKRLSDFTAFAIIKTMEKFRGNSTGGGLVWI